MELCNSKGCNWYWHVCTTTEDSCSPQIELNWRGTAQKEISSPNTNSTKEDNSSYERNEGARDGTRRRRQEPPPSWRKLKLKEEEQEMKMNKLCCWWMSQAAVEVDLQEMTTYLSFHATIFQLSYHGYCWCCRRWCACHGGHGGGECEWATLLVHAELTYEA